MKHFIWPIIILLIIFRYFTTRPVYKTGDRVRITGTLYSDPVIYPTSQYLRLAGLKVYLPLTPQISYGDKVIIEGNVNADKLEKPKLVFSIGRPSVLSNLRNKIVDFYQNNLPQPESGLLAGIVLGAKGPLDQNFYNQTKLTGVAHVVVASGTNVTFVVSFLMAVFTVFLPRRKSIVFVIVGIIIYLFLAGFDAPLVRAAIMSGAIFMSQEAGRLVSTWRIFILTAGLMLIYNPDWVIDVGFILSFASTGTLLLFERRIREKLKFIPEIIKEDLSTSLAAQIGVAPILFVTFGQFNIWSPLINVLVLWTVAPLMVIGAVGGLIGLVAPFLGKTVLLLGYPLLWWFVRVVSVFS